MDEKDYREIIAAEPSASFDDSTLSAAERASADAFRREMQSLDERIARALSIDVPELRMPELLPIDPESSIDPRPNVVQMPVGKKRRLTAPAWIGIAASVAIAAGLGVRFFGEETVQPSLAAQVVAHLDHEPQAFAETNERVAEQRVQQVAAYGGAEFDSNLGLITYASSCVINGKPVPHLVLQGKFGPITVLLMPGETVDGAVPLSGDSISGVILPVGNGSIAIIGEREENMADIEQRVVDSVTWSI